MGPAQSGDVALCKRRETLQSEIEGSRTFYWTKGPRAGRRLIEGFAWTNEDWTDSAA